MLDILSSVDMALLAPIVTRQVTQVTSSERSSMALGEWAYWN